jgi:hypothetical protein
MRHISSFSEEILMGNMLKVLALLFPSIRQLRDERNRFAAEVAILNRFAAEVAILNKKVAATEQSVKMTILDSTPRYLFGTNEEFEGWYSQIKSSTNPTNKVNVVARLLTVAARIGFQDWETMTSVFNVAQSFGTHFLPVHFYSPVPDTTAISDTTWSQKYDDIPNLAINRTAILEILSQLSIYGQELVDITDEPSAELVAGVPHYHWVNPAFDGGDASVLYAMIRYLKPKRVIEIGSGFSTLIGLKAIRKNTFGQYTCIEPYPNENIKSLAKTGDVDLMESVVQSVPLEFFQSLEAGDILFIDSSHICKTGSDVVYELLKIIPHLERGVTIHLHDILFPGEYQKSWVVDRHIFWNEQYILMAFLAFNNAFNMLIPNQVFVSDQQLKKAFQAAFPYSPVAGGGSFWFERVM